jgi:hypothetical protein
LGATTCALEAAGVPGGSTGVPGESTGASLSVDHMRYQICKTVVAQLSLKTVCAGLNTGVSNSPYWNKESCIKHLGNTIIPYLDVPFVCWGDGEFKLLQKTT